jgi:uncharacterized protein YdeI (YjbR/CyaY-like superfamily)
LRKESKHTSAKKSQIKANNNDLEIISFDMINSWEFWLEQNHLASKGIWLKFYKKGSGVTTVKYGDALDVALCYGWIDGQLASFDENAYIQKFTPRKPKSIWSKKNIERIERLQKEGKLKPSGLKVAETAKADGRWSRAYDSPANMTVPQDLLIEISKNKKTLDFFNSLNRANKYAIIWRLQTAKKPETRARRMLAIIKMLESGKKFHY